MYDIGSNFCLNPPPMQESIFLQCLILEGGDIPQVVPQANRTWVKDGIIIYSGVGNEPFNEEFLMSGNNSVFMVGVINPPPLNIMQLSATGGIVFNTEFFNVSMSAMLPEGVTEANFQEATFQAILGDYTCSVDNVYGGDSAMTTIRVCGRCGGGGVVQEGGGVIQEGGGVVQEGGGWRGCTRGGRVEGLCKRGEGGGVVQEGGGWRGCTGGWRGGVVQEGEGVVQEGEGVVQEGEGVVQEGEGVVQEGEGVVQEGEGVVQEGEGVVQEGEGVVQEGEGVVQEGEGVVQEGEGVVQEGEGVVQEGEGVVQEGEGVEGEGVEFHACIHAHVMPPKPVLETAIVQTRGGRNQLTFGELCH